MFPSGPIHPRVQEELERSLIICGDCRRYIIGMRLVVCERCGAQVCEECSNSCDFCRAAGKLGGYCCECSNKELEECATCSCGRLACYDHCKKCESCHTVSCIDCQSQWPVTECGWCGTTLCDECGMSTSRFSMSDGRNYGICEKCLEGYEGSSDKLKGLGKRAYAAPRPAGLHPAVLRALGLKSGSSDDKMMNALVKYLVARCCVLGIMPKETVEDELDVAFTDREWKEVVKAWNEEEYAYEQGVKPFWGWAGYNYGSAAYATGPLHPAVEKRLGLAKKFTLDQAMDKVINECLVPAIYSREDIEDVHGVKLTDDEWEELINGFNNADTSYAMEGIWDLVDDLLRGMGKK